MSGWERVEGWASALSMRERLLVLATAMVAVWALASLLVLDPLARRQASLGQELETSTREAELLAANAAGLEARLADGPEDGAQRELARLEREIEALDARLTEAGTGLVPPAEMSRALERLLASRPSLRLVRLETEGSEPVLPSAEGGAFYRHRVVLEVEGDFAGILATLRALEALPWPIRWDALRYEVVLHPFARATLRFHTLGPRAEWVGA